MKLGERSAALGIGYRDAADRDMDFLYEVYAQTRLEELAVTDWTLQQKRVFLHQQFTAQHTHYRAHYPGAEWLVIEQCDSPIGRLYIDEWAAEIRIVDIALLPAAQGRGIGSEILSDLVERSERARKPLSIHVEHNNPAMTLYRRLGFTIAGDAGVYQLMVRAP